MAVRVRAGGEEGGSGDQLNNHIGSYVQITYIFKEDRPIRLTPLALDFVVQDSTYLVDRYLINM